MNSVKIFKLLNYQSFFLFLFFCIQICGCSTSNKYKLIPSPSHDTEIIENFEAVKSKENLTVKAIATLKNRFVVFQLSIENNSEIDIFLVRDDFTILDSNDVIQDILDVNQMKDIFDSNYYISFFTPCYPFDDPFYWDNFYPYNRHYYDSYYRYSIDRKMFIANVYKEIFQYGKIPVKTKRVGNLYIQQDKKFEYPLKLIIRIKENEFSFKFNENLKP